MKMGKIEDELKEAIDEYKRQYEITPALKRLITKINLIQRKLKYDWIKDYFEKKLTEELDRGV